MGIRFPRHDVVAGGPLDGLLLDITSWTQDEIDTGAALCSAAPPRIVVEHPPLRQLLEPPAVAAVKR
ncbi:hypothetical protein [Streptomyces sp. NPDC048644]|uniref:hypothetical protein n=1 Tax=Streptomyces sp. NPDC048644 TaxID=3365582 RepID=UPI00371D2D31